jgi:hypothetical protein
MELGPADVLQRPQDGAEAFQPEIVSGEKEDEAPIEAGFLPQLPSSLGLWRGEYRRIYAIVNHRDFVGGYSVPMHEIVARHARYGDHAAGMADILPCLECPDISETSAPLPRHPGEPPPRGAERAKIATIVGEPRAELRLDHVVSPSDAKIVDEIGLDCFEMARDLSGHGDARRRKAQFAEPKTVRVEIAATRRRNHMDSVAAIEQPLRPLPGPVLQTAAVAVKPVEH